MRANIFGTWRRRAGVSWAVSWLLGSPCHCTASNQSAFLWSSQLCSRWDRILSSVTKQHQQSQQDVLLAAEEHASGVITGLISSKVVMTAFMLPDVLGDRMQLMEIWCFLGGFFHALSGWMKQVEEHLVKKKLFYALFQHPDLSSLKSYELQVSTNAEKSQGHILNCACCVLYGFRVELRTWCGFNTEISLLIPGSD